MARLDDPSGAFLQLGPFRSWWEDPSQPSSTWTYTYIGASNGTEKCETTSGAFLTWELHWLAMLARALVDGVPDLVRSWSTLDDYLSIDTVQVDGQVHVLVMVGATWDEGLPPVNETFRFYHLRLVPGAEAIRRFADELEAELAGFPIPYGDDPNYETTPETVAQHRALLGMRFARHTTVSADGTLIAYSESGSGPAVVLAHGYGPPLVGRGDLLHALAQHFTVYTLDPRGTIFGGSGPYRDDHVIERDVEDLTAVIDAIGGSLSLMGVRSGALYSLEATFRSTDVRRLVLEDPVLGASAEQLAKIEQSLARMNIAIDVDLPLVVEIRALMRYQFEPSRFRHISVPVLVLCREERGLPPDLQASQNTSQEVIDAISTALPHARVIRFSPHYGRDWRAFHHYADEVIAFLQTPDTLLPMG